MIDSVQSNLFGVAIVGMAGRFPGARSLAEYWDNLFHERETIRSFSEQELLELGVDPSHIADPNFVPRAAHVPDADLFAASFFGYTPGEARLMDPQQRLFLECSWEALENAGYSPRSIKVPAGIFAGCSLSTYLLFNLLGNESVQSEEENFQVMIGNDKDFLCTRLSYKLNLKGPSMTVQSGCSTSLVAVHAAVQSLLSYQCDLALAGGVSVGVPQRTGYHYQEGGINSPDGHCRVFDAEGAGTIFGHGVGMVVLKRLDDAINHGDTIYAVILGSAINNDGSEKIGYTAPSIEGQAEVITRAQAIAGVTADTISYVEAHGTATALGDPAEIAALTKAFRQTTTKNGFCAVGSVKSNIGHLDAAAGVAGLIKTVLMLKHRFLVPSLHYRKPNSQIDFSESPFYVVTELRNWESKERRRAGVSSFGIGGTNAHVVLEEAPDLPVYSSARPFHILSLSAQTAPSLKQMMTNLAVCLEGASDDAIPDVAYTLHVGREAFKHRVSLVCERCSDAVEILRTQDRERSFYDSTRESRLKTAFLFPGGGTQYPGMGQELYETEPEFRRHVDHCCAFLKNEIGYDLKSLLYPPPERKDSAARQLARPSVGLPAIFLTEYSLAQLLMSWGINPSCFLGHSLGEYTAACLAGVFSLDDVLALVAFRGRLFESLPSGAMLSVYLPEQEACSLLNENVSIAAINSPDQCVISGTSSAIDELTCVFAERNIEFHRLHIDASSHSVLVEPVMEQFRSFLLRLPMNAPSIPFISNRTGTWIGSEQATDPEYWVGHLRHTVRFADGIQELMAGGELAVLEVGPSRSLTTLAIANCRKQANLIHGAMRHPQDAVSELPVLYRSLARLWNAGMDIDWSAFYKHEQRRRIPLPTYPFERQRYWLAPQPSSGVKPPASEGKKETAPLVYATYWKPALLTPVGDSISTPPRTTWILMLDEAGVGDRLKELLAARNQQCVTLRATNEFVEIDDGAYRVRPQSEFDLYEVFRKVQIGGADRLKIVHLWSLGPSAPKAENLAEFHTSQRLLTYSLLAIAKALGKMGELPPIELYAISNEIAQVSGAETISPEKSPWAGALRVLGQEYDQVSTCLMDFHFDGSKALPCRIAAQIHAEASTGITEPFVAFRGTQRWIPEYRVRPLPCDADSRSALREHGVYWITGGLGELGPVIAQSFAAQARCKLVLTGRSVFPPKSEWQNWVLSYGDQDQTSRMIRVFQEIEGSGSELLLLPADVSDEAQMSLAAGQIEERFGAIHGVIHLAGVTGSKALKLLTDLNEEESERQFRPKVGGCYSLGRILEMKQIDFCVLFSSTASILGGAGMTAYAAANSFVDCFAEQKSLHSGQRWISVNWDAWLTESSLAIMGSGKTALDQYALTSEEALRTLHQILAGGSHGQHIVSKGEVHARVQQNLRPCTTAVPSTNASDDGPSRLALTTEYVPPATDLQREIATVWAEVLGIEQIGLYDNLFELGGNSLIALRIISRLKRSRNIELPIVALFESPTVFALSQTISSQPSPENFDSSRRRGEMRRKRRVLSKRT